MTDTLVAELSSTDGANAREVEEDSILYVMKCSLGISNFLEEISSLSHSVAFLHLFALFT